MDLDQKIAIALSALALTVLLGEPPVNAARTSHGTFSHPATHALPSHGLMGENRHASEWAHPDRHEPRPVPTGNSSGQASETSAAQQSSSSGATVPASPASTTATQATPQSTGLLTPVQVAPLTPAPDPVSTSSGGQANANPIGGGGATLADCMALWDRSSHMTRTEWRVTCRRTLNGIALNPLQR